MIKERLILLIIRAIDFIVNNDRLTPVLNYISEKALKIILFGFNLKQMEDSLFKGMSVAFIADGNRRWHRKEPNRQCKKVRAGVRKIEEISKFAYFYNLKEVSFYCFSIKNFRREKSEVDEIMDYIKKYKIFEYDIPLKIRIYGRMELLEEGVRDALNRYEKDTESRKGLTVNLFFSYSSSDEEARRNASVGSIDDGHQDGSMNSRIKDKFFDGDVDLLIRTSGERRLSDFMVKQVASGAGVDFVRPTWPEFSLIHLFLVLLKYKLEERMIKKNK